MEPANSSIESTCQVKKRKLAMWGERGHRPALLPQALDVKEAILDILPLATLDSKHMEASGDISRNAQLSPYQAMEFLANKIIGV